MNSTKWPSLSYLDKMGYSKVNLNLCFHQFRSGVSREIFHLIICKSLCILFPLFCHNSLKPHKTQLHWKVVLLGQAVLERTGS